MEDASVYRQRIQGALDYVTELEEEGDIPHGALTPISDYLTGGDPDATPAQAAQDRPGRDEAPVAGGADGAGQESAAERRTRDHRALAQQWANEARAADPALGTVYALTAIAHAILATKETP